MKSKKISRGSKMPVSSAKRQNTTRHQKALQVVPRIARLRQGVVQVPGEFGGLDVGGVLIAEGPALHAQDEAEFFDVGGQVGEGEDGAFALVQIVKFKRLEIAHEDVAGAVVFGQCVEILTACP